VARTSPSGQASVPDVDSDPLPEAIQFLQQEGLTAGPQEQRANLYVQKGLVITTDPAVGSSEPAGFAVTLLISDGPPYCPNCLIRPGPMPSVIGETFNQAVTTLAEDGLSVQGSTDQPSSAPAGQVIESDPAPGADIYPQATIELTLSSGTSSPPGSPSPDTGPSGS
jgi:eukaryotic-like serine/threonine-protein kinase